MTLDRIITVVFSLFSLIGTITTIVVVIIKIRPEMKKMILEAKVSENKAEKIDAEASSLFLKIAVAAGEEILKRDAQNQRLESEVKELRDMVVQIKNDYESKIMELNSRVNELDKELQNYLDWSKRLVHQLKSHSLNPVPMIAETKKSEE